MLVSFNPLKSQRRVHVFVPAHGAALRGAVHIPLLWRSSRCEPPLWAENLCPPHLNLPAKHKTCLIQTVTTKTTIWIDFNHFTSFAVSLTECPSGHWAWTAEPLILSLRQPALTPPQPSDNSHWSRERHTCWWADSSPWGSDVSIFLIRSDDSRTLAENCSGSGLRAASPASPLPLPLIWRKLKRAWTVSAVESLHWDAAFLWVTRPLSTCRACNQSTVSMFRGKVKLLCESGRLAASSPRRLEKEKMSKQLTVMGKDASPAVANGSTTSKVSPGWTLWNGKEKFLEVFSPPSLGGRDKGNTVTLNVQPCSKA